MSASGLIWCSTPTATVGLVVEDGIVVDCPPYARRWALGRDARDVWFQQGLRRAQLRWVKVGQVTPSPADEDGLGGR